MKFNIKRYTIKVILTIPFVIGVWGIIDHFSSSSSGLNITLPIAISLLLLGAVPLFLFDTIWKNKFSAKPHIYKH